MSGDNRILPITRGFAVIVVVILVAAFIILYLFPARTEQLFAWTINPPMTAILMGAGYMGGAYFFIRTALSKEWHRVHLAFWTTAIFSWFMLGSTVLHWDRFNRTHPVFVLWLITYIATSTGFPILWFLNRKADPKDLAPGDVESPGWLRIAFAALGGLESLVTLWMFFLPQSAIAVWPWLLTPLTSRIVAGWFSLTAAGALLMATDRRWSAQQIILEGALLYLVLVLIGIARAWGDFDPANPLTYVYTALIAGSVVALIALWIGMGRAQRTRTQ